MHPHRVTGNRQARTAQWQRAAINDGGHDREDNQPVAQASSARFNASGDFWRLPRVLDRLRPQK